MIILRHRNLNPAGAAALDKIHLSPNEPPIGRHWLELVSAIQCETVKGVLYWVVVRDYAFNQIRRLTVVWLDHASAEQINSVAQKGDIVQVTATRTTRGRIRTEIKVEGSPTAGDFVPHVLAARWSTPVVARGPLGWPFLRQKGGSRRLMVVNWRPKLGLDEADFTQSYDGVSSIAQFGRRLSDLAAVKRLIAAAAADGRPVHNDLSGFQDFIAQLAGPGESASTEASCPPTVLYTWLHPHSPFQDLGPDAQRDADEVRVRTFREVFCRFQPELVLVGGERTSRELAQVLGPIETVPCHHLPKLRPLKAAVDSDAAWTLDAMGIRAHFGNGSPFNGTCAFLPVYDLSYFGLTKAGPNSIPVGYWAKLENFLRTWLENKPDALVDFDTGEGVRLSPKRVAGGDLARDLPYAGTEMP